MAGIGFELRKAIQQESVAERTGGYIGAAFSCSGSMLVGIIIFILIQTTARHQGILQETTDSFMCYVTNTMFLSMLVVSLLTLVLSRYVSDQLYLQRQERVMPSLIGGICVSTGLSLLVYVPILLLSDVELSSAILLTCLFLCLNACWLLMTYITLLRDYKQIVKAYLFALILSALILWAVIVLHLLTLTSMIFVLMTCFATVDVFLFRAVYHGFSRQDGSVFRAFLTVRDSTSLIWIGFFMMLGMLGHFWVVWFFSGTSELVDTVFRFGPDYDFPAIVAYFSTIPASIYFVTLFETEFSENYQNYFRLLGHGGTVKEIYAAKENMIDSLYHGFRRLCSIQLITCLLFITVGAKFLDVINIGMTDNMLNTFRIFCVGYSVYYIGNVVTLIQLYFVNEKRVFWTSLFFAAGSNIATFIGSRYFSHPWGIGFTGVALIWTAITVIQLVKFLSKLEFNVLSSQPLTVGIVKKFKRERTREKSRFTWIRCTAAISLCLVLISSVFLGRSLYSKTMIEEFHPEVSDSVLKSPGMGLAPWAENDESLALDTTLVYVELKWADWEPEEGIYDIDFVNEYYNLDFYREDDRQVVFRFICDEPTEEPHIDIPDWLYEQTRDGDFYDTDYGTGYSPNYENELFIEKHKEAIFALGEAFGNDDFFCYVELGSLGHWGEWHVNFEQGVTRLPDYSIRKLYIEPYLAAFPNAQFLMRYPLIDAASNGFGLYNDMTGDYDETLYWIEQMAGGVWEQTGLEEQAESTETWKTHPIGGELASTYDDRIFLIDSYDLTVEGIKESHQSFIGPKIIIDESDNQSYYAAMQDILKILGYRFRVSQVTLDFTAKETFKTICTITNDGIAPIYQQYQPVLYIYDTDGELVWESEDIEFNLMNVLPGEEYDIEVTVDQDELDDDATYVLCIALTDSDGNPVLPMALTDIMEDNIYAIAEFSVK